MTEGLFTQPRGSMPKIESIWPMLRLIPLTTMKRYWRVSTEWYFVPMTASDMARLKEYKPIAEMIAQETGRDIKLIKFSRREVYPLSLQSRTDKP